MSIIQDKDWSIMMTHINTSNNAYENWLILINNIIISIFPMKNAQFSWLVFSYIKLWNGRFYCLISLSHIKLCKIFPWFNSPQVVPATDYSFSFTCNCITVLGWLCTCMTEYVSVSISWKIITWESNLTFSRTRLISKLLTHGKLNIA